jgi:superfamily II DNA or RNA helicase
MATGLGKAVLFATLRQHHGFEKRVMVLVHREELAAQAADKLLHWNPGLMVGVEMAQHRSRGMDTHVVASVPTLGRNGSHRLKQFDPAGFDCIVSDEAHHATSPQWARVLDYFGLMQPGAPILSLGLTATPNRSDGIGLRRCFDEIVYDMGIDAGIREGYLVDLRCWRISTKSNLDSVRTTAGDFNEKDLAATVNTPERNGMIVKAWAQHAKDKKSLVFTADVQHALDLAEAFKALGVGAAAVWGDCPDRAKLLKQHRTGELMLLTNCAVLTEGYDDPNIECIVLARPTKSALLLTQMIGRGTRMPDGCQHISEVNGGKRDCIILDVVDTTSKHQLCTVPSLLGLPAQIDLKGAKYQEAKGKIERVAKEFPTANLADLRDLDKLDYLAQQFSLFTVKYPTEVEKLTELAWRKQGDGYILPVRRDRLTLCRDLRDEWWVRGNLNGKPVEIHAQNLAGAFNAADREVMGINEIGRLVKRDVRWHNQRPTEKQIGLCRKLRLQIPAGATRGQVSAALDSHFGRA